MWETWVQFLGQEEPLEKEMATHSSIHWRRKWQPTPVFLPGKSHGWRSLVDYSPWGCKELYTTERLHFQYSCLENPMDQGAWWATAHGVAKSRT